MGQTISRCCGRDRRKRTKDGYEESVPSRGNSTAIFEPTPSLRNKSEKQSPPSSSSSSLEFTDIERVDSQKIERGLSARRSSVLDTHHVQSRRDEEGNKVINQYTMIDSLGKGSFGKVKLCVDESNMPYAIKIMNKDTLERQNASDNVQREIAILKKLEHPNIVRLYEVIDDPEDSQLYLVFEYVSHGALMNIDPRTWMAEQKPFDEDTSRRYFRDILQGISYLHSNNILHRDIKTENFLRDNNDVVKVADLGVGSMFSEDNDIVSGPYGTPAFAAPESASAEPYSGRAADIWALGVVLYCMCFGRCPFIASSLLRINRYIQEDTVLCPPSASSELVDLLKRILVKEPSNRAKMDEIRQHPWVLGEHGQLETYHRPAIHISAEDVVKAFSKPSKKDKAKNEVGITIDLAAKMKARVSFARGIIRHRSGSSIALSPPVESSPSLGSPSSSPFFAESAVGGGSGNDSSSFLAVPGSNSNNNQFLSANSRSSSDLSIPTVSSFIVIDPSSHPQSQDALASADSSSVSSPASAFASRLPSASYDSDSIPLLRVENSEVHISVEV